MARRPGPTIRRRQLGRQLRELREKAGIRREDAAEYVGLSLPSMARGEGGKQSLKLGVVRSLLEYFGVTQPLMDHLITLAKEAGQRGWWLPFGDTVPDWFRMYVGLESDAAELWAYEGDNIHGLFQTREYAKATMLGTDPDLSEAELQKSVDFRMARQENLTDEEDPLIVHVVMNESSLTRMTGGVAVMFAQLRHLHELARRRNVTVQIVPNSAGAHAGQNGAFIMLRFDDEPMSTVYVEYGLGALYLEKDAEIDYYANKWKGLTGVKALSPEDSLKMIARLGDDLERGQD